MLLPVSTDMGLDSHAARSVGYSRKHGILLPGQGFTIPRRFA
jgi:hypothetical protein